MEEQLIKLQELKIKYTISKEYTKQEILQFSQSLIDILGKGWWVEHTLTHCKKSELLNKCNTILDRFILEYSDKVLKERDRMEKEELLKASRKTREKVLEVISNDRSRFVGEGEWVKDSCYQVHEVDGKFYAIIVAGQTDMWLMDETLEEIKEEDIEKYVEKF